jgi:hypothetical protein
MLTDKMMAGSRRAALRIAQALLPCLLLPAALLAQNWTVQSPATSPSARSGSAMVYDSLHHQTVLFGGESATNIPLAETWTYDGTTWTKQNPLHSPPARVWPGMAFDATHGQVVLFGGTSTGVPPLTYLHDTWLWNGTDWTNPSPLAFPTGRQAPAMAYGSPLGTAEVYLFGGSNSVGTALNDTWAWDGTNWTFISLATTPPGPRRFASMSYDPVDGVLVLFAGDTGTALLDDTWTLDEAGWSPQSPHNSPSPRTSQGQAWDPDRQLTVMFGGSDKSDTWTWNGSNWTVETTQASPPPRSYVNMVYDQQHADMVLFGGLNGSTTLDDTETLGYVYTQNWMQVGNSDGGPLVANGSAVFQDSSAGLGALLFGGSNGTSVSAQTWLWDGNQWSQEIINSPPPARQSAAMAYDPVFGLAVLFGGNSSVSGTTLLGDTWTFNGSSWNSFTSGGTPPSARENHAMAYDDVNHNTVLFGGYNGNYKADTWFWTTSGWSQLAPSVLAPSARANHGMVFDAARGQITLFGGYNGTAYSSETWVWNGSAWTKLTPLHSPSARSNFSMVYDSIHGRVLLFGGVGAGGQVSDTWSWDGVDWTSLSPVSTPNVRVGAASAFVPGTGQFVLIGGELGSTIEDVTWIFASPDVPSTALPVAFFGQSYSNTIPVSGGLSPYTFTADGAPYTFSDFGLSLNTGTGAITGTSTATPGQNIPIGVTIQDSQGQSTDITFFLQTDAPLSFNPGTLPDATEGANYSVPLSASGGTPPYTFQATGLPAGITLNVNNTLVGQCTASSGTVELSVIDSVNGSVSVGPLSIPCNPAPLITSPSPLPNGKVDQGYIFQFMTNASFDSPGAAPYTWSTVPSSLPPGLTLGPQTGLLMGTPTASGVSTFTITFTDRWNATTSKPFQLTVANTLAITTSQLPDGTLNIAYPAGAAVGAAGGDPPYNFSATGLPTGLTINNTTGAITGSPTVSGTFNPAFDLTDQTTVLAHAVIPITVAAAGTNSEDWIQLSPTYAPTPRIGGVMFYDSVHNQTILFGGVYASLLNETDVWNGTNWTLLSPTNSPSPRTDAAAAFDATHGVGVLFGGRDAGGNTLNETWLWNGTSWTLATPANSPSPRINAMMAYDGQQIVLFGGVNSSGDVNETWVWNGSNWTQITAAVSGTPPEARDSGAMAYDSAHGQVVLFGGIQGSGDFADTWIWNGAHLTWTLLTLANHPQSRNQNMMAYDPVHGQTILFGGNSAETLQPFDDTWAWNASAWTELNPPHSPGARTSAQMTFDAAHSQVLLFGGEIAATESIGNDTWILEGPFVSNLALPDATQNVSYSASIPVQDGVSPFTFVAPTLPPGITFNATNGTFGGAPTGISTYNIPVTIQDSEGVSITPTLTLTVSASLTLLPATLPNATASTNYLVQLSASGGVPAYSFSVSGLPAGLQFNSSNQIVGQCTASSTNVILKVTDSATPTPNTYTVGPLTVTCNALPAITSTSPLPDGIVNKTYSQAIQMTGGTAPITWSLTPGTLPSGFTLSSSGVLTGNATAPVVAQFSVTVTDFWNAQSTAAFQLSIESVLTISSTALPPGLNGTAYPSGITLGVSGGTGTGTYTFGATGLPSGLQIDHSTGAITGIPTQSGIFQPTFTVTDETPQTVIQQVPIEILAATGNPNWTNLNPPAPPGARDSYAMAYDPTRAVTTLFGGTNFADTWTFGFPSTWTKRTTASSPPGQLGAAMAWMASENDIVLFGGEQSVSSTFYSQTWVWDGDSWLQKSPTNTPQARSYPGMASDSAHSQVVMFGGTSTGSYANALSDTWVWDGTNWNSKSPGTVPAAAEGPSLADGPTGPVLFGGLNTSGTPLGRTYVWDGSNWNLQTPIISPPARAFAGMVYNSQSGVTVLFGGLSGTTQLQDTWQWDGHQWTQLNPAAVPAPRSNIGLSYDSTYNQILVFGGQSSPELDDTWTLGGPVVVNTTLPGDTAGVSYSAPIPVIGGTPPYSFAQTGSPQSLPSALNLNPSSGQITGATTSVGAYSVGVTVTDSQTLATTPTLSLTVSAATSLVLSPLTLPNATAATNYNVQLSAAGGTPPYSFSTVNLPAGLQLNSSNQIAGQCTGGSTNVSYSVTDSSLPTPSVTSVTGASVKCNALPTITTASPLPSGIVGTPYSASLQMTGGTAPITWSLTPGTLPSGFQLSSTGVLTGTPAAPFSAQFSVTITDFWGASFNKPYTLAVYPVLSITTSSLPNGTAGTPYQSGVTIAASGGTGSGTYSFTATGLPNGYSVDLSSGTLSGNTTQTGPFTPTFKVTDQDTQIATKQINLTVLNGSGSGLTILSPKTLPDGTSGQLYSYQLQWTGGVSPFNVTSTALPSWLTLNAGTGLLTGTPTSGGAFVFPITVTDSQAPTPNTASQPETIVVNPPTITTTSPLPAATIGIAYAQNLAASGGKSPYNWTSTNLPAWLSLSSAGALTGTPPVNTPSSVSFNTTVTDSLGAFTIGSFTLPVQPTPGLYFLTTSPLPAGTPNVAYSTTVQVGGGNGVYTVGVSGLPAWLNFNSTTLVLSGTPPSAGPVTFQLILSDNVAQSLTQNFTLPVNAALTFGNTSPLPPATVGLPYSETLTASGGSGSYRWSATGLPSRLSLSTGGVLSGSPTVAGPVSFGITVTDSHNTPLSGTFVLPVEAILIIDTATPLPAATLNFPYLATFTASGGGGGYQWSATGLPSGFTLSPSGFLLGTPQAGTPIVFNVTVTDSLNNSVTGSFTLPVNVTLTINTQSPLPPATVLLPYSANFTASGGNPGYTWTATGLPSWLNLTAAGYLSGTPPAGATAATFPATVTDSATHSATSTFTVPMNGSLTITTASLPLATVNVFYSQTLAATGGDGVYTWSATGLPSGLSISPAGVLSGSVSQAGPYSFPITVNDTKGSVASKSFTLLVSTGLPLSYVTQNLTSCVANTYCSNQIVATGGVPPYTFSLSSTANLDGFSISASGLLSGTPPSGGVISIPVVVTDQVTSLPRTFTQTVYAGLTVTTTSLVGGTVGVNYGAGLSASGGQPPYKWSLVAGTQPPGSLPPGLTLDSQGGDIYGTPGTAGTYTFSVQVTDGVQTSPARQLSITIAPASAPPPAPLTVANAEELPSGTVGTAYSDTLTAVGGSGQYTWTLTSGSLPAGLSLASNGAITGTPTTGQTANFNATVNDTGGNSVSSGFTILVTSQTSVGLLTPNPLPNGVVGVPYNYAIEVTGGTPPYTYSITAGQVPPGLTFDETTGALNGTPTTAGSFGITLTVEDSGGTVVGPGGSLAAKLSPRATATVTSNYTIGVSGPGDFQIVTGQDLPGGTLGFSYSTTLTASGGQSPYQWRLVDGTLPLGLVLTSAGTISGTPAEALTAPLVIKVTDNTGAISTGAFLLQIIDPKMPSINAAAPLPPGTVGVGYGSGLTAAGGHTPYTWQILTGTLPPGLSLDAEGGIISGTPSKAGNFPFTAQVTDTDRVSATQDFAIVVHSPTLQITPSSIPNGTAEVPYSFGLSVAGGTAPYNWSLSAGGLLSGFSINPSTGAIGGTPTVPGAYQFTISVIDSNFGLARQTYQFTVNSQSLAISTASVPPTTVGAPYDFGLLAANSTPPLTWSVTSGTLPPGIQLVASSGLLVGTPTAGGNYTFTVQVTDQTTAVAQATFMLLVSPPPLTIVTTPPPGGSLGTGYSLTLQSSGGTGTVTWSVTSGTLPAGLSLGATTGIISGTPTAFGTFTITVEATDSNGVTAQQSITLNIAGPPPAPAITLGELPATSKPGDQPTVTITLASPYPLPIVVTATLSLTPNPGNSTDLKFANGLRTTQLTIPASATTATLPFQTGTLAGTIQLALALTALGVNITPAVPPTASTVIAVTAPTIASVAVATTATGLQVTVVGTSTTLDMKTATFQFTPAAGATLQTTSLTVDVSSLFAAWYQNPASLATGSQFSLTEPFTISGNVSAIASVTVTLTNSVGASSPASANVP